MQTVYDDDYVYQTAIQFNDFIKIYADMNTTLLSTCQLRIFFR